MKVGGEEVSAEGKIKTLELTKQKKVTTSPLQGLGPIAQESNKNISFPASTNGTKTSTFQHPQTPSRMIATSCTTSLA